MQAAVHGFSSFGLAAGVAAAVLVASLAGCTSAPDPPDQQSPTLQSSPATATAPKTRAFVAALERYSAEMRAAGATAVIIQLKSRLGEWSSAEGVRSLENQEPVQLTDQTHIGDITMTMVAVSVMKLVEEGKVQLDDPIQKYLPDFESIIKPPGPITIRSLLSHRSGMPHYWDSPIDIGNRRFTHEERLSFVAAMSWTGGSGSRYYYSNTNYSALALLVEKLRGKDIGAVIHDDNVVPLALQDTLMTGEEPGPQRMVHGYTRENGELFDNTLAPFHAGSPDTGMISTVPELNTYFAALQKGTLLTLQSVQEMHHPKYETFGLGLVRRYDECSNNDYFGHVGVVRGYAALALISADGSRQVAMAVSRAPAPDLIGFDDERSLEMAGVALEALNLAC
ncbi:beta-lactamase family protein [Pseudarthrobacter sp. HLT3-5]|uniref:serine hydrolase domain-containing protein n=1 Tax=Pseudarthrobacter cellobiosi TaxID=2953654 RepID=UPI00208FC02F|nr:serine hydrolase domain-containing protein [Pseudarthrobacter sp. HLT3-5]MCO4273113.1 beta-lactamase family protein [Pseudarthrobacter sp. HLT3-5]